MQEINTEKINAKKINVGVLGTGRIGKIHIKNLFNHSRICIKGVADPFVDRAFVDSLGLHVFKDSVEMLSCSDIDAVFICTSSDTHYALIKDALAAKKAIFCEKPVDLDLNRILEIDSILKKNGGFLQVGFNRRFDENFSKIASMVRDNAVGNILQIHIVSRDFLPPPRSYVEGSGGMFLDMSIHDFDMLRYLSSSEVDEVFVMAGSYVSDYGDIDVDTASILLRLQNGCVAQIENCRLASYGYDQRVEVFGDKGRVFGENKYNDSVTLCNANNQSRSNPLDFFLERYASSYKSELEDFIAHFSEGKSASVGIKESINATLIALAVMESHKSSRAVKVAEIAKKYNL